MNGLYIITGYKNHILNSKICVCVKKIPTPCDFSLHSNKCLKVSIKCNIKFHAANGFNAFLPSRYSPKNVCIQRSVERRIHDIWNNNVLVYNLLSVVALWSSTIKKTL